MTEKALQQIREQLLEIETVLDQGEGAIKLRVPRLSAWSVAQQLDHVLLALERSLEKLLSRPEGLPYGINWTGRMVLALGWFPRGVARAPKGFEGRELPADALRQRTQAVRQRLNELAQDAAICTRPEPVLKHPYFGGLDCARGLQFLAIHTHHHLKIVRKILKAAQKVSPNQEYASS